nr:MAG TPA_asm: hypothetical protein [Caudoviricetes sp.]
MGDHNPGHRAGFFVPTPKAISCPADNTNVQRDTASGPEQANCPHHSCPPCAGFFCRLRLQVKKYRPIMKVKYIHHFACCSTSYRQRWSGGFFCPQS